MNFDFSILGVKAALTDKLKVSKHAFSIFKKIPNLSRFETFCEILYSFLYNSVIL